MIDAFHRFSGVPVQIDNNLGQVNHRVARPHKKRRTAKKWRKRFGFKYDIVPFVQILEWPGSPTVFAYQTPAPRQQMIVCNQLGYDELIRQIDLRKGQI